MNNFISPNFGLDLVRVTEQAALVAGRWMGLGKPDEADHLAAEAMASVLNTLDINGHIIIGEEGKLGTHSPLDSRVKVGTGNGPTVDVVSDPIDGTNLLSLGHPDAISVIGVADEGAMWSPYPAVYMEKLVVGADAAEALVPECMDAPAAWTLALVARVKNKSVRDMVVFILDRPRHHDLIEEVRSAGARVIARSDGDIAGSLMAVSEKANVDILMGTGGVSEGVIAACAIKSLGGAMLGRLAPQTNEERSALKDAGMDTTKILSCEELVTGRNVFFAATGITDGVLLSGVHYHGEQAETESLVIRCSTGTQRIIHAEHRLEENG
jgi:fructose-1,6-bisphosphatase II